MVAQNTMRAVQFRSYGAPEVLKVGAVEIPSPGPKEVVVEVAAFSVNAVDLLTRRGKMRLLDGMGFPKGTGVDFAGLVHAVGDQVGKSVLGRRVWGYLGMRPPGRTALERSTCESGTTASPLLLMGSRLRRPRLCLSQA